MFIVIWSCHIDSNLFRESSAAKGFFAPKRYKTSLRYFQRDRQKNGQSAWQCIEHLHSHAFKLSHQQYGVVRVIKSINYNFKHQSSYFREESKAIFVFSFKNIFKIQDEWFPKLHSHPCTCLAISKHNQSKFHHSFVFVLYFWIYSNLFVALPPTNMQFSRIPTKYGFRCMAAIFHVVIIIIGTFLPQRPCLEICYLRVKKNHNFSAPLSAK